MIIIMFDRLPYYSIKSVIVQMKKVFEQLDQLKKVSIINFNLCNSVNHDDVIKAICHM